ncbi:hypothetical protein AMELA_G00020710, partial [Ameiurus melas]
CFLCCHTRDCQIHHAVGIISGDFCSLFKRFCIVMAVSNKNLSHGVTAGSRRDSFAVRTNNSQGTHRLIRSTDKEKGIFMVSVDENRLLYSAWLHINTSSTHICIMTTYSWREVNK